MGALVEYGALRIPYQAPLLSTHRHTYTQKRASRLICFLASRLVSHRLEQAFFELSTQYYQKAIQRVQGQINALNQSTEKVGTFICSLLVPLIIAFLFWVLA